MGMDIFATPLEKAKRSFNEAVSGQCRGVESFCKLLNARSNLSLAGFNRESEKTYAVLNTTKQEFDDLLRTMYRRAALENYQDSTEARFAGSGRAIFEALSDLHLVPVYMKDGGLDPLREESWAECGLDHNDYLAVYNAHRVGEAARIWNFVKNPDRKPASNCIALEAILNLLKDAGLDVKKEETYHRIQTTKQDFDSYFSQQRERVEHPFGKLSYS